MAKRRGSENNKDIRKYFCPSKRKEVDPDKGDTQLQGEDLNNQEENLPDSGSVLKDLNHKTKIKSEESPGSERDHSHHFLLKCMTSQEKYPIHCDHPQTVLQAILSKREIRRKVKCDDDKIVLQKGEARMGTAISTHFPCSLLEKGELVILTCKNEKVEVRNEARYYNQDEDYAYIFIETKGGIHTSSKKLLRSSLMTKFSRLCVYGIKDMTLKDAIEQDGRFEELCDFKLEDASKAKTTVFSHDKIQQHHKKTFRICLERNFPKAAEASSNDTDEAIPNQTCEGASNKADVTNNAGESGNTNEAATSAAGTDSETKVRWVPVSEVVKRTQTKQGAKSSEEKEIYKRLREQFPELKRHLLSRYQEKFKKVDFGKAQQAFSDVFRLKKLFELGRSVCKIIISDTCEGTGFMLFTHYILTNAHLFDNVLHNLSIQPDIQVTAMFNYEEPHQQNTVNFKVRSTFIDYERQIDYAILELVVNEEDESKVPPGLIKHCSPMPEHGEACIIGHPNGGIKKFDPTCIIEKEKRKEEVDKQLQKFKNDISVFTSVRDHIQKQGIERIVQPSDTMYTTSCYHTFMYHGSSGSPVFDMHCRVFGMHTGGFAYDLPTKGSVIEYARPVLLIFQQFVTNLKQRKNTDLLAIVEEESKSNCYLKEVLIGEEPMDES